LNPHTSALTNGHVSLIKMCNFFKFFMISDAKKQSFNYLFFKEKKKTQKERTRKIN